MQMPILALCDGDWSAPEIQISGKPGDLARLGRLLLQIQSSFEITTADAQDEYYPVQINFISFDLLDELCDLLSVNATAERLIFSGSKQAFAKLGESIVNSFDDLTPPDHHFHLNYFEGNGILNETACELIFVSE